MSTALRFVTDQLALTRKLQSEARDVAEKARVALEQRRREHRRRALEKSQEYQKQLGQAVQGTLALCQFGSAPEMQELISLLPRRELVIWGLAARLEGSYHQLALTENAVVMDDMLTFHGHGGERDDKESTYIRLPYLGDELIYARALREVGLPYQIDVEEETEDHLSTNGIPPDECNILFQVLVDCADPEKLEKYVRRALAR